MLLHFTAGHAAHRRTVLSIGIEGGKLRLSLRNNFLPVHALLQTLEHALLSDSLDVPSEKTSWVTC